MRTSQLQIRVSPSEKAALKRLASAAGQTVSGYVLSRVLPTAELRMEGLLGRLEEPGAPHREILAELAAVLETLPAPDFAAAVPAPARGTMSPVLLNTVASLVESEAHRKGVDVPAWTREVPPLRVPHFGWALRSLRPHQIRVAPVAFKRRYIFFDPATGPSP